MNVTARWIDVTTLEVMWDPLPVTAGITTTYIIYYSTLMETRDGMQTENEMSNRQMSETTMASSIVIRQLDSIAFYQIAVTVNFNENQSLNSVGIGVCVEIS